MKLSPWTIIAIGFSVFLVAISFALFSHWMPNMTEKGYYDTFRDQLQTEIDKRPLAQRRVDDATAKVEEMSDRWQAVVSEKTPSNNVATGGVNIGVNAWQLVVDSRKFRNSMQRAFNNQVRRGGVTVINGPAIPEPTMEAPAILSSYYNYPAIGFPVVMVDFGTITVRGTYAQIVENVRSWTTMPNYLVVADGLQFTGTSPQLTATYNLSMVAFIRGNEVFPAVPEGGSPSAPGGGGGAAPGRPGGGGGGFADGAPSIGAQ